MKIKVTTGDERDEDADSDNQPLNDISPLNGSKRPGANYIGSNIESRQTEGFGYNQGLALDDEDEDQDLETSDIAGLSVS